MPPEFVTLTSAQASATFAVADTPIEWSIDAAPALTLTVPDPHRKLVFDPGTLGDAETDLIATLWGRKWAVSETSRGEREAGLTLAHRGVAGMRAFRGKLNASDDMSRAQFASQIHRASRAGKAGDDLYVDLVNPEASGYRPPVLAAATARKDRDTQKKRDTALAPGFKPNATLKVKGQTADAEQKRVLASGLSVADDLKAPRNAKLALLCALIIESTARNLTYGDATSTGTLQLLSSTAAGLKVDPRNVEAVCRLFLTKGFYSKGGAIAQARKEPGKQPGAIAQDCQGSAHGGRYQTVLPEARAILAAWTGGGSSGGGGGEEEAPFSLGDNEDGWAAFTRLATESNRRAYATLDAIYWVTDNQVATSRPLALFHRRAPGVKSLGPWNADAAQQVDTMPLELVVTDLQAWQLAGHAVEIAGEGTGDGVWIVSKWSRGSRRDRHASFELTRARPFLPESQIKSASSSSSVTSSTKRQEESSANQRGARSGLDKVRPSGEWAGTKSVFDQFIHPFMRRTGLTPGSQKRSTRSTASGNVSDHFTGATTSYACDYPTNNGEAAARALAQAFGFTTWQPNSYVGKTVSVGGKSFRLQILWGAAIAHGDHVHAGLRAL